MPRAPLAQTPSSMRGFFLGAVREIPWILLLAAAGLVFWSVPRLYKKTLEMSFPRESGGLPASELDEKARSLQKIIENKPDDLSALTDLAITRYQQGPEHYEESLVALEKARDLGALDDRLFYYAGVMYEAKGLLDYARTDLERFLRRHPDDLDAGLHLGNLYYRTDELEKARKQYEMVLAARPLDPLVAMNLAFVLRDGEKWQEGLSLLEAVKKEKQLLPLGGEKLMGDLSRGAGHFDDALSSYQNELARNQADPDIWEGLALTYGAMGRRPESLAAYQHVLELSPKNRKAQDEIRQLKKKIKNS